MRYVFVLFLPIVFGYHLAYDDRISRLVGDTAVLFPETPQYKYRNVSIFIQDATKQNMLHPTFSGYWIPDKFDKDLKRNMMKTLEILDKEGENIIRLSYENSIQKPSNLEGMVDANNWFFSISNAAFAVSGFNNYYGIAGMAYTRLRAYRKNFCWITINTDLDNNFYPTTRNNAFPIELIAHEYAHSVLAVKDGDNKAFVNVFANNVRNVYLARNTISF